jgi:hypothetical protein
VVSLDTPDPTRVPLPKGLAEGAYAGFNINH